MAIQSFQLDPNAVVYTDDEIVGKVNSATADITRVGAVDADAIFDGTTNKAYTGTEQTKLGGIEDSATADQTGAEVRDAIVALGDTERQIVITDPQAGEFTVVSIQRDSSGKLDINYDDVAE